MSTVNERAGINGSNSHRILYCSGSNSTTSLSWLHGLKVAVFTFVRQRTFFTVSTMCCTRGRLAAHRWFFAPCDWLRNTRFARLCCLCFLCEDWNYLKLNRTRSLLGWFHDTGFVEVWMRNEWRTLLAHNIYQCNCLGMFHYFRVWPQHGHLNVETARPHGHVL